MDKYVQFKKLLEYFVAHLNWLQNKKTTLNGYAEYIEPLLNSESFISTGQGYNQQKIQKQISKWDKFKDGQICINVQGRYGDYKSVKCYLNWLGTGINIVAKWSDNEVIGLCMIIYSYWKDKPTWDTIIECVKIADLGLFKNTEFESQCLRLFYDKYNKLYIEEQINKKNIEMKKIMEPYINLLLDNHNLVLTGAPGTGKTYLAKQIASQFILGKEYNDLLSESEMKQFNEQCTFVQFHPSYDYTDFVEGLKPIYKANCNDIGFERKDGIFKSFCHAAIDNKFTYSVHSNNDESSKKIRIRPLKELNLNILYNHFYNLGVKDISDLNGEDFLKIIRDSNRTETKTLDYQYYQAVIQELLNTENDQNSSFETKYKYLKDKIEKQGTISLSINKRTYIAEITSTKLIGIQSSSNCEIYDNSNLEESNEEEKKFVFIIDEINRGEISKIIGELFFSIDPGYRGPEGTVKTQYQNLISDIKDPFYEGFYVPTNVYIIGTMNDIDRSVESMDFAMRRRFAWKEISANDRKDMWNGNIDKWKAEAENRMDSLNAKIESIPAFNKSYHIGPAYFLKLKYYDGKFELLWKYHIKGLLAEYLRGMTEAEELLGKLEKAYNLQINTSDENDG